MKKHLKLQLIGSLLVFALSLTACTVNIHGTGSYNGNGSVKESVSASDSERPDEGIKSEAEKTGDEYADPYGQGRIKIY